MQTAEVPMTFHDIVSIPDGGWLCVGVNQLDHINRSGGEPAIGFYSWSSPDLYHWRPARFARVAVSTPVDKGEPVVDYEIRPMRLRLVAMPSGRVWMFVNTEESHGGPLARKTLTTIYGTCTDDGGRTWSSATCLGWSRDARWFPLFPFDASFVDGDIWLTSFVSKDAKEDDGLAIRSWSGKPNDPMVPLHRLAFETLEPCRPWMSQLAPRRDGSVDAVVLSSSFVHMVNIKGVPAHTGRDRD